MLALSEVEVQQFWRDGYFLAQSVFTEGEIADIRARVERVFEGLASRKTKDASLPGDLSTYKELCTVVTDRRLLELARTLLGGQPVYFRDSTAHVGSPTKAGWHKDNRLSDRFDPHGEDWSGRYPILRMGLYCEDHLHHSGGLSVRAGSHTLVPMPPLARLSFAVTGVAYKRIPRLGVWKHAMLWHGRPRHVGTRVGDVAVWNLRTTHTGHSVRTRFMADHKFPQRVEKIVPRSWSLPEEKERIALFLSFGTSSPHLSRYLAYLETRDYFQEVLSTEPCPDFNAAVDGGADVSVLLDRTLGPDGADAPV